MESKNKSIFDYIEIGMRRKWVLILPTVAGLVIAGFVARSLPSYYRSTTMILIEGQKIPEAYVKSMDQDSLRSRLNTLKQEIMSRTRLEKVASEFNLYDRKEARGGLMDVISKLTGRGGKGTVSKNEVVSKMKDNIDVKVIANGAVRVGGYRNPDAFSVSYISTDPELARDITNKLATLFIDEHSSIREHFAQGTSKFLKGELAKAKKHLEKQENSIKVFRAKHMGALPEQLDANLRTLDRLQLELQAVSSELRMASEKKSRLEEELGSVTEAGPSRPSGLQKELASARKKLLRLRATYNENYPDVIMAKSRVKELESRLDSIAGDAGSAVLESADPVTDNLETRTYSDPKTYNDFLDISATLSNLNKRKSYIKKQIAMYEHRVEVTPTNEQRLSDIKRDYTISLQNYQSLLEKKLNARLAENLEKNRKGESFRVLDPAFLPAFPFKPNRQQITLYGGAAGFGLGLGMVLLLELVNPAFIKPEDFAGLVPLPVLITIPSFSLKTGQNR